MTEIDVAPVERELPPYFAVSLFKFVVMSVCTAGLYHLWWFYKNWYCVKRREQSDIMPAWRAVFAYFWCYACLCRMRSSAATLNLLVFLPAGFLTIGWIITEFLYKLPGGWWLLCYLSTAWLVPAQIAANRINFAVTPDHDRNGAFDKWNWAAVIIGGGLLILIVIETIFVPQ